MAEPLVLGANPEGRQIALLPKMANRHGLIAGATGTGKTISLQLLAEHFSDAGVPVFLVDVKGDLSGLAASGKTHVKVTERIDKIGLTQHRFSSYPVEFWDVYGNEGIPVRTTLADMGPILIARLLDLNENQEGILSIAFAAARDQQLALLNLDDLRSMLNWLGDNAQQIAKDYGNVSTRSIGAIQRKLLTLSESGGNIFFGEPALDIQQFICCDPDGRGVINILSGSKLILNPTIYGTLLFWLLTELFENLPEIGDPEKPKLVFFFDEAHLLFDAAPKVLQDRIEQVVRLIRSKGVGIYFVTQSPSDVPEDVLGQLGNRVQHALRAFTPKDQKAVKIAAETFRANPSFDAKTVITELGVGEALVSVLDEKGSPTPVERTLICPPQSKIGPIPEADRQKLIQSSTLNKLYATSIDSKSAHEILLKRRAAKEKSSAADNKSTPQRRPGRPRQSYAETLGKSVLRSLGSQITRMLINAVKSSLRKRR